MRLDDPRDLPHVAGGLQRDPVTWLEVPREQLKRLGSSLDPAGRAHPTTIDDRDLAEIAMHIQRSRSHHPSLPSSV
jgi:hypothetical protein